MADKDKDTFDKDQFIAAQKAKHNGSLETAIAVLGSENFSLREDKRELKKQVKDAKESRPAKDAVVLTKDEHAELLADKKFLEDLGIEKKAIKESLEKLPELEKENGEMKAVQTFEKVGQLLEFNPSVLRDLQTVKNFSCNDIIFKTEKDEDKKEIEVAYLKTDDKEQPFKEFAENDLANFLPALKVDAKAKEKERPGGMPPSPKPGGVTENLEAEKAAKDNQMRSTHSIF